MVTMTSEVDTTETTIALTNKSRQNPILKSTQQPTKAIETTENVTTKTKSAVTTATNNNHLNTIITNNTNQETINDQITELTETTTSSTTLNTNGIASVIEFMKTESIEKDEIEDEEEEVDMASVTNGKECYKEFDDDNSSNKENLTIVNNIVTVEICCNTTVTETATPSIIITTTTATAVAAVATVTATAHVTTMATIMKPTTTNTITIDNGISSRISAITTTTTTTNDSVTLIDSNITKANISSADNGKIPSSSCHPKPISHHTHATTAASTFQQHSKNENAPNILVYKKMEAIIEKMQAESTGVTVRTVKGFITKVPSVFTGADLIAWILKNLDIDDVTEALHFAHLLSSHGYIFPIDDHALTVKNDGTFYRFQTPYFWPSNCWEPENTDYAVYLCKRTMQNKTRLELADYEAENLAKLQKMFSRKWEFIFMQAESQSKVAKKRDKLERKVLDSQERAFWDVHRPMPGCVNTTEIDIKKAYRRGDCSHGTGSAGASVTKNPIELLTRIIALRKQKLERRTIKISKAAEALVAYYEQYHEFDYFVTAGELPNPWQTDSTEMWDAEKNSKEVPLRNVKRWAFNMRELLKDPVGREQFAKFLEKEYSVENILFWEAVQEMKALPQSSITKSIQKIWQEFLAPDAPYAVNIDSKSIDLARDAVNSTNPNRWCFDVAAAHIYHLMERDSYTRYLRSDMYKDFLNCSRKKVKSIPNLFGVKR